LHLICRYFSGLGLIGEETIEAGESGKGLFSQPIVAQLLSQMESEFEIVKLYFANKHEVTIPAYSSEDSPTRVEKPSRGVSFAADVTKGRTGVNDSEVFVSLLKCSRLCVLLVEDNDFTAELLTSLMQEKGMQVTRAKGGHEALRLVGVKGDDTKDALAASTIKRNIYDLCIMDVSLGSGIDGITTAQYIREWEVTVKNSTPHGIVHLPLPIIGLSASETHREKSINVGMDLFCTKPLQAEHLLQVLQLIIRTDKPFN
jgi:CheY-like chemotaxis protein